MRRLRQQTRSICENGGSLRTLCWAKRSEEHTSELQSRLHLVCRLLLEKKKKRRTRHIDVTILIPINHPRTHSKDVFRHTPSTTATIRISIHLSHTPLANSLNPPTNLSR